MRPRYYILLIAILILSPLVFINTNCAGFGCGPQIIMSAYSTNDYELLSINSPKHMYVSLKSVKTGEVFKDVNISKWCNFRKENAIVGDIYRLEQTEHISEYGKLRIFFPDAKESFC